MAQSTTSGSNAHAKATWLLPSNRKLRNLLSISLRNLTLTPSSPSRNRGKTIDDDAVPYALKSPAKLVALREQKALGHSRSSSDLRAVMEDALQDSEEAEVGADVSGSPVAGTQKQRQSMAGSSPRRPGFKRLRRRSTIEWANATLQKRQERLQLLTQDRMADVFFSLHTEGIEGWYVPYVERITETPLIRGEAEPIYISETIEKTMNPTFRHIDWNICDPGITRLDRLVLRVWVKGGRADDWRQLIELKLHLISLQYLAKSLESLDRGLPQNAVLFHVEDGIYTSFADSLTDYVPPGPGVLKHSTTNPSQQRQLPTSSFDALLRLSKLDDSIQDALATRNQIASELESLLEANKSALDESIAVDEAEDRLKTIEYAKKTVEKQLEKATKQQDEKRDSIVTRRRVMQLGNETRNAESQKMQHSRSQRSHMWDEHDSKTKAIHDQRRRICEALQSCFPIEPLPGKTLAFTIRGLHLPNSESLDSEPPDTVCAALGYVAQILELLAFYLSQTLPYPVTPLGSTSSIHDPISLLKTNKALSSHATEQSLRTYPLFSKGVPRFRFEYAVFLINQNIRVLLESAFNLRILDIRQTLPNLKYLLYVATAGAGELPTRKAGGVRGLMRGSVIQRVASTDSTSSSMSGLTLHENGKPRGAVDRLREISGKGKNAMRT